MRNRRIASPTCLRAIAVALVSLAITPASSTAGQDPERQAPVAKAATAKRTTGALKTPVPRTPDGHPDLQGVWAYATVTPLERPKTFGTKAVLTEAEAKAYQQQQLNERNVDRRSANAEADVSRAYNDFWWDYGKELAGNRTSLIVSPADGRIPPLTPEGEKVAAARSAARMRPPIGPEDRALAERCLLGFNAGPPMIPSAYNNHVQIFQTGDHIALLNEMIHQTRVISLKAPQHLGAGIRLWLGDSRAHWEGDTLVVDTTNFNHESHIDYDYAATPSLHVVERFKRLDADNMLYSFTIEDPNTWTTKWSGELPMTITQEHLYEYACHEGNHAMENMLNGARADERAASPKK